MTRFMEELIGFVDRRAQRCHADNEEEEIVGGSNNMADVKFREEFAIEERGRLPVEFASERSRSVSGGVHN